jgi:hypothetical protein
MHRNASKSKQKAAQNPNFRLKTPIFASKNPQNPAPNPSFEHFVWSQKVSATHVQFAVFTNPHVACCVACEQMFICA